MNAAKKDCLTLILGGIIAFALGMFAGVLNEGPEQEPEVTDMIKKVYDRVPDGVRDKVFGLMESLSGPSVVNASDEVKGEVVATLNLFSHVLGSAMDNAIQTGNCDQLASLRQRMEGDWQQVDDLTRRLDEQNRRDRAEDAKGGPAPTEKDTLVSLGIWSSELKTIAKIVKLNKEKARAVAVDIDGRAKPKPYIGD